MSPLLFLAPAGLLALLALALPLLIHLFSRSRGRRVLVGNIALYRQAKRRRVSEPRLVQWLLLLLRLALLALAALLLAGLARTGLETLEGNTAYLTPAWNAAAAAPDREALARYDRVLLLAPGTPPADSPARTDLKPSGAAAAPHDIWSLLAERLATHRHTGEVHVYAQGAVGEFSPAAPALSTPVTWHLTPAPEPRPPQRLAVHLVHTPGRASDAGLLRAALDALATHRAVTLTTHQRAAGEAGAIPPADPEARQVLIWLGDGNTSPPPDALDGFDVFLEDLAGTPDPGPRVELPGWPGTAFRTHAVPTDPGDARIAWRDAAGDPLLLASHRDGRRHLRYLSRFGLHPDGLAAQATFPDALLRLLLGPDGWAAGAAHATADPGPAVARPTVAGGEPYRPLAPWLALAMGLLFGLERWLSERPAKTGSPVHPDVSP